MSVPERQNGHVVGTDRPKEDETDRDGTKDPELRKSRRNEGNEAFRVILKRP